MNSTMEFFELLLDTGNPSRLFYASFCILVVIFVTPLFYSIVWYDRYGFENQRTLVNRLVVFQCWIVIAYILIVMTGGVCITLFSPLPSWYCETHDYLKNVLVIAALIAIDSILVARFILIFCLKNSLLCHDDFLNFFVRVWTTSFALINQFVHFFFPGKKALGYYICIRDYPLSDHTLQYKVQWFTVALTLLSVILCTVIYIKIKLFIIKGAFANHSGYKSLTNNMFANKLSLLSVLTTMIVFLFLMMGWKSFDPFNLKVYPNYHIYWLLNTVPPSFIAFYLFVFLASKDVMRNVILRKANEFLNNCKPTSNW